MVVEDNFGFRLSAFMWTWPLGRKEMALVPKSASGIIGAKMLRIGSASLILATAFAAIGLYFLPMIVTKPHEFPTVPLPEIG
jgi:hypothetical protein